MNSAAILPPVALPGHNARLTTWFLWLAGGLLTFHGTATFIVILQKPQMTAMFDPILGVPVRWLMLGVGLVELLLAMLCLFTRKQGLSLGLLAWLALNLIVYRIGLSSVGWPHHYGYVGPLVNSLDISPFRADVLLMTTVGCLLVGSGVARWLEGQPIQSPQPVGVTSGGVKVGQPVFVRTLKISCTACAGHIEFPTNFFGERIPCPHCQTTITLQKARNLKMACTACAGHLEFPDHALGQTIPCPHCKMDITLKEPS